MQVLKRLIRAGLASIGYDIVRIQLQPPVPFSNFENLAEAYEHLLNETEKSNPIQANTMRAKLLARLLGTPPSEAYFIVQGLAKTRFVDGDVCEFGVAQGETSALIANEIADSNKTLHLFDSFEGLPRPSEKDQLKDDIFSLGSMEEYTKTMSCPEGMVTSRLKAISFPREKYVIHRGYIEDLIYVDKSFPQKVSFAYVDFDFYEPIKIALQFLHQVTPTGAVVIVDDYNFFSTGAKAAVDEFIGEKNCDVVCYDLHIPHTQFGSFAIITKVNFLVR